MTQPDRRYIRLKDDPDYLGMNKNLISKVERPALTEIPIGKSSILRDYFLLLLFTGLRKQEAIELTWDRVDLKEKTITINDTKNHQSHVLPLSDFLFNLFENRKAE